MTERLYPLLPAVLRLRDAERGEPLRALMALLEVELDRVQDEADTAWDNAFIETCEEWLVPYIGDALGVTPLRQVDATGFSMRAHVANTLAYRRRKGTAAVLEQLARDLTGHGSSAVEYFQRTLVSGHQRHLRTGEQGQPAHPASARGTLHLGDALQLERLGTPFARDQHTPEVRRLRSGRGRWNLPNVGLHLWRHRSLALVHSEARAIPGEPDAFHVHPHGRNMPLFQLAEPESDIASLAGPEHMPAPLSRRALADEERGEQPTRWLGPDAVVRVHVVRSDGSLTTYSAEADLVFDDDGDGLPDRAHDLVDVHGDGSVLRPRLRIAHLADTAAGFPTRRPAHPDIVHLDPETGRLVFHPAALPAPPRAVLVDHALGFLSELGAGPWDRSASLAAQLDLDTVTAQWGVSATEADGATIFARLGDALDAWNSHVAASADPAAETGLIVVMDNRIRDRANGLGTDVVLELPQGARLVIAAADWPAEDGTRLPGRATPTRLRAVLSSDLRVRGGGLAAEDVRTGGLWLNGLSIEGGITVDAGSLERLDLAHCTLVPGAGIAVSTTAGRGLAGPIPIEDVEPTDAVVASAGDGNTQLALELYRCITGALTADGPIAGATLRESAVLGALDTEGGRTAIDLEGAALDLQGCTVVGTTEGRVLDASNCILDGRVRVEQTQSGCVRFSYVPRRGRTPRRYRCQPDRALEGVSSHQERSRILARTKPTYQSLDLASPACFQLAQTTPDAILRGSEDRNEQGVFHHLQLAWRYDNLVVATREYLRHGLEAGLLFQDHRLPETT